ncbi:hypothetical protein EDB80DRAFT_881786 [Ilyonectria destructans]|nr:hypothetical protein EDB80DRAFT_881786 [Ilyonectria destructans]
MALAWRSMIGWRGSAGVAVVVLLATSLHPIVAKIRRRSAKPRSGTLEVLSGGDDAKFEFVGTARSSLSTASVLIQITHGLKLSPRALPIEPKNPKPPYIDLQNL